MNLSEAKGFYTIVAIKGNKVVEQMRDIEKKELKDAISFMKKAHKGAKISVEDSKGKVVKTESYINRFRDSSFLDELFGRRKSKKNNKIKDNSPLVIRGQGDYKKVTRPSDLRRKTKKESVELDEVSPPGWENTVKKMKKHKDIDNPWALAWYMKNKGYTPKSEGLEQDIAKEKEEIKSKKDRIASLTAKLKDKESRDQKVREKS